MIYLVSTSPRRRMLLKKAGYRFKILKPSYEEKRAGATTAPAVLVKRHALAKALSAVGLVKSGVVIGADTVVYFEGKIIGKPRDRSEAFKILGRLQGRWHTVYTGVALLDVGRKKPFKKAFFCVKTAVLLKPLSTRDIRHYLKSIPVLDKAGAYAIQSRHFDIVSHIRGSFSNAIGLPMERLSVYLRHY